MALLGNEIIKNGVEYVEFVSGDIAIMICSICNAMCKHCYIKYDNNIDPDVLYDLLEEWKERYDIVLNGTEPILNSKYFKSFQLIGQKMLQTNGLFIYEHPDVLNQLLMYGINELSISYHFQAHELISTIDDNIVKNSIALAVNNGFKVSINCTVTPLNYNEVIDNCNTSIKMGVNRIHFTNYLPTGKNNTLDRTSCLSKKQKKVFFEQLNKARNIFNKDALYVSRCGTFEKDTYTSKDNFYCEPYRWGFAISPDKKVYPCIFMVGDCEEEVGFVHEKKIYIKKNLKADFCDKCLVAQKYIYNL